MLLYICNNMEFTIELVIAEALFLIHEKKKKQFGRNMLVMIIIMTIVSLIYGYEKIQGNTKILLLLLMGRWTLLLILSIAGILFCYDISVSRAVMYGVGGYTIQNMAFAIQDCFKTIWTLLLPEKAFGTVLNVSSILIIFSLSYICSYLCFARKISSMKCMIENWKVILLSSGIILIVVVLSTMCHSMDTENKILFRTLSILGCILSMATMTEMHQSKESQLALQMIRHQAMLREQYYDMLKVNTDAVNSRCHDFKHQIAQYRVREGQTTAHIPDGVLRDLENSINIYDAIVKTGNEELDTVLTDKSIQCYKENIRFTYMIDEKCITKMAGEDIYSLFGNILDNAMEAVMKIEETSKRVINITVVRKGAFVNIHSYNYYETPVIMENGIPQTTKPDAVLHGYGMKSIRMIVDKYEGEMTINAENHIFNMNIVFPVC